LPVSSQNLASLKEIAELLNRSADLSEALHGSLDIIVSLLDLRLAWVFLEKEDGTGYRLASSAGLPVSMTPGGPFWSGGCQCNTLGGQGKLSDAVNIVRCSRIENIGPELAGFTHHASVPLETPRGPIGILNVVSGDGRAFSRETLEMLTTVGNQMGVAIERATLFDRIRFQRLREQRALVELSSAMLMSSEAADAVRRVTRVSLDVFEADLCILALHDGALDGHACFQDLATEGLHIEKSPEELCALLQGPVGRALAEVKRPVHVLSGENGLPDPDGLSVFPREDGVPDGLLEAVSTDCPLWHLFNALGCRSVFTAPIRNPSCRGVIGQLYVLHRRKPELSSLEHLTELLANQAALAIQQARLEEDRLQKQALESELGIARDIQRNFLPDDPPRLPGWQIRAHYEAAREVGGDFYDFIELPDGRWGFVIADVSGKGVPAALVMVLARTLMSAVAPEHIYPTPVLDRVNQLLEEQSTLDRFLSVFYAVLDPGRGELRYGRAGHNPPYWLRARTSELVVLDDPGIVLGVTDDIRIREQTILIEPGDRIVMFTDGVTEAMNIAHEEYGESRLEALIRTHGTGPLEVLESAIHEDIAQHVAGAPASDDLTLIVLGRDP